MHFLPKGFPLEATTEEVKEAITDRVKHLQKNADNQSIVLSDARIVQLLQNELTRRSNERCANVALIAATVAIVIALASGIFFIMAGKGQSQTDESLTNQERIVEPIVQTPMIGQ